MIIKFFSDIHLEFHDRHNQADVVDQLIGDELADIIIIAGDLTIHNDIIEWLHYIDKNTGCPVLFVPGNHEYYGNQKVVLDEKLLAEEFNNVHVLIQKTFKFMDTTFAGATGWWDTLMGSHHLYALNDFNRIYDIRVNNNGTTWGVRDRRFFQDILEKETNVICISHNAPSWKSINPAYLQSDINECFANHWDKMINKHQPIAWFHGHMHNTVEYTIGKTQIVCNPYGYDRIARNDEFMWNGYVQLT